MFILLLFELYIYFMCTLLYVHSVKNYFSLALILTIIALIIHIPLFVDSRNGEMSFLKFSIVMSASWSGSVG